jgi:hypothetical protein
MPPVGPTRSVTPSRALVPVEKAGPRPLPPGGSPLDRSGVALDDLLFAPDLLETRQAVAPVALEMGLESARGQLLRQLPGDALISLDAIWPGAATTEEGWYLRAGALTVLGHPGDGERIASAGLETQPGSLALRLMQSVARAVLGDLSGARAALAPALDAAPGNPVLTAQQAVVLARQGHADDAGALLDRLALDAPNHPALSWARSAVRSARADRARSGTRAAYSDVPRTPASSRVITVSDPVIDEPLDDVDAAAIDAALDVVLADEEHGDLVAAAFVNLGRRIARAPDEDLIRATRTLLRACSTGGTLASAGLPDEAHAARQLLTAILVVIRQDDAAPSPVGTFMAQWLPLLRPTHRDDGSDRLDEAQRLLRRAGASMPPAVRRLLDVLLEGATHTDRVTHDRADRSATGEFTVVTPVERESGPLLPVRLGLSLLTESAATRALERSQLIEDAPTVMSRGEMTGEGWGAARANPARAAETAAGATTSGASLPVILCVAGAIGAAMTGAALLAGVLAAGAVIIVLRRSPNRND